MDLGTNGSIDIPPFGHLGGGVRNVDCSVCEARGDKAAGPTTLAPHHFVSVDVLLWALVFMDSITHFAFSRRINRIDCK